jgi:type VI secretion system protein ImpL
MFLLGWLTEKAFDHAGKSGLYFQWGQKKAEYHPVTNTILSEEDDDEPVFSEDAVSEHLRFRYGRAGSVRCDSCW